ncbi:MAG TPA: hypothetical protein VIX89_12315 [Bryobacteraceae bacterium]
MPISTIMIVVSTGLLIYWFRYTCRLILNAKPARDYTQEVAAANELRFLQIQEDLPYVRGRRQLDNLQRTLERDYRLLSFLLRHTATLQTETEGLEQNMLMLHFNLMKAYYSLICAISQSKGRVAIQEMGRVVSHFANRMGERAVAH